MNPHSWKTPLLIALAAAAPAFAAEKQTPPVPGQAKDFRVPPARRWTLDNGLAVTLVSYGRVPKATIRLALRTGSIDEKADQVWLASLMGDLLSQGTASRTASELAEAAARMGGSLDVNVGQDRTEIGGDVLSEFVPDMVALVADLARNPRFPESELARLKTDRLRQLSIAKSQPQQIALEKFRATLYPGHPYGRTFPAPEALQAYRLEEIRAFYDANFGAARSHLYVVGRFDRTKVEAAVRKAFSDWKRGAPPTVNVPHPNTARAFELVDRPGAVQSTIYVGMPVTDPSNPDYIALSVTNALLGGSFGSRITSNIREQKGYTYSPASQVSARYRDAYWAEVADVTTNVTGPSLKEIFGEIERLQKEPPSEQELKGIENYLAGTFVLQNSSRSGIVGQFEFLDLHGLSDDWLNQFVARVNAVTPADVRGMTQKYILPEKATIVVVGDQKAISDQLAPYSKNPG